MPRDLENHMLSCDEDDWKERNSWPEDEEYDKYNPLMNLADCAPRTQSEQADANLRLRISLAIQHLVNYNSFDHRDLIQLLKDCERKIERG